MADDELAQVSYFFRQTCACSDHQRSEQHVSRNSNSKAEGNPVVAVAVAVAMVVKEEKTISVNSKRNNERPY